MTEERNKKLAVLQRSSDEAVKQRNKYNEEIASLQRRREEQAAKLKGLQDRYADACKLEALGRPNDHEKLEREITSATAKASGIESLISEKKQELQAHDATRGPIDQEISKLQAEEKRERETSEATQSFEDGKKELMQCWALEARTFAGTTNFTMDITAQIRR
jgi:hypothetical protein